MNPQKLEPIVRATAGITGQNEFKQWCFEFLLSRWQNILIRRERGFDHDSIPLRATQERNSEVNADNQELTTQVSQRDSQNPNIIVDSKLRRVIEAWGKLPANLKTAIMAIVASSNLHG